MWCLIVENSEAIRAAILILGLLGGGYGLYLARWRCLTADRNLLRERCQMGLELLSLNPSRYTARVAGATILSNILNSNSSEYDSNILRAFEAFLFTPPGFGMDLENHKKHETDYEVGTHSWWSTHYVCMQESKMPNLCFHFLRA